MAHPSRRTPGLSSLTRTHLRSDQFAAHGTALRASQTAALHAQLGVFQALLHDFSATHAADIRSNPAFRAEFARMCAAIGVDPLLATHRRGATAAATAPGGGGSGGSWWAQMLGGSVNDFYFELAVRVVEVCRDTRAENGGLIAVAEVRERVQRGRGVAGGSGGSIQVSECVAFSLALALSLSDRCAQRRHRPRRGGRCSRWGRALRSSSSGTRA